MVGELTVTSSPTNNSYFRANGLGLRGLETFAENRGLGTIGLTPGVTFGSVNELLHARNQENVPTTHFTQRQATTLRNLISRLQALQNGQRIDLTNTETQAFLNLGLTAINTIGITRNEYNTIRRITNSAAGIGVPITNAEANSLNQFITQVAGFTPDQALTSEQLQQLNPQQLQGPIQQRVIRQMRVLRELIQSQITGANPAHNPFAPNNPQTPTPWETISHSNLGLLAEIPTGLNNEERAAWNALGNVMRNPNNQRIPRLNAEQARLLNQVLDRIQRTYGSER